MGKIIIQDCIEGMKQMDAQSVDICVTSPPYNLNINYGTFKDDQPRDQYLEWLSDVFEQVARVLKPNGHFWLNMGFSNVEPWVGMDVAQQARKHLTLQNNFIWAKSIAINDIQHGHYKPINSERFANPTWEHLFHFTHSGNVPCDKIAIGVPYADKANVDNSGRIRGRLIKKMGFQNKREFDKMATPEQVKTLANKLEAKLANQKPRPDLHCPGNIWYIPYETISDRGSHRGTHPATYPVALVERAIKFSGLSTGLLLDPFMGTGTSAVAAKNQGLDYLGFDIDEAYVGYALGRLKE